MCDTNTNITCYAYVILTLQVRNLFILNFMFTLYVLQQNQIAYLYNIAQP